MQAPNHDRDLLETLQKVGQKPQAAAEQTRPADPTEIVEDVGPKDEHARPVAPPPARVTLANIFRHPDAHPVILDVLMLRKYGPDWLGWEPETIEHAIIQDFSTGNISDLNLGKINACKTLHLVDSFWQRWEVFNWCTMAFNGIFPDFSVMQVPTVGQMLVSVDVANRIREDSAWTDEVLGFMRSVYKHDGMFVPVPPADMLEIDHEHAESALIEDRWPAVRASRKEPQGETIVNEQLRRMLHVNEYLEESRARLHQQMELIRHE